MYVLSLKMIDVSRHFLADPCIYIIQVVRSFTSLALINPALINNQVTDFFSCKIYFPKYAHLRLTLRIVRVGVILKKK